jgi:hypothetical protein
LRNPGTVGRVERQPGFRESSIRATLARFPASRENNREFCIFPLIAALVGVNSCSDFSVLHPDSLLDPNRDLFSPEQGMYLPEQGTTGNRCSRPRDPAHQLEDEPERRSVRPQPVRQSRGLPAERRIAATGGLRPRCAFRCHLADRRSGTVLLRGVGCGLSCEATEVVARARWRVQRIEELWTWRRPS